MNKTVWIIAIIGTLGIAAVLVMMAHALALFQKSPQFPTTVWTNELRSTMGLRDVLLTIVDLERSQKRMTVEYAMTRPSLSQPKERETEMRAVALEALKKYPGDRKKVVSVFVLRHETHAAGCSRTSFDSTLMVENPEARP